MERQQWTTTFRKDLRKHVNILAAELGVKPNHVLEIAFEYLKKEIENKDGKCKYDIKQIISEKYDK